MEAVHSISDIWSLTDQQLQSILATKNKVPSSNRNFDRTVAATILYNEKQLDAESMVLVQHPKFNSVMINPIIPYSDAIKLLELYKIIVLQKEKDIIRDEFDKYFDDFFVEMGVDYYQPNVKMIFDTISKYFYFYVNHRQIVLSPIYTLDQLLVGKIYQINYRELGMIVSIDETTITYFDIIAKQLKNIIFKQEFVPSEQIQNTIFPFVKCDFYGLPTIVVNALKLYYNVPTLDKF